MRNPGRILPHRKARFGDSRRTIARFVPRHCAVRDLPMPARRKPLTIENLWAIKRIGSPTSSPDGSMACAAVTIYDMEKNEGRTELWLFPADGGRARRLTAGDKDSEPVWSPDGRWIAFTAKRKDDEEAQIYLIAPD